MESLRPLIRDRHTPGTRDNAGIERLVVQASFCTLTIVFASIVLISFGVLCACQNRQIPCPFS